MSAEVEPLPLPRPRRTAPAIESEVLGMLILVATEVMFFAGFLSAWSIVSARSPEGFWPPPGDPPLPAGETAVVTLALLLSGILVAWAGRSGLGDRRSVLVKLGAAAVLAIGFVVFQVVEFVQLVGMGLTVSSSAHGGFVFVIVGCHAVHAVVAIGILFWAIWRLATERMSAALFLSVRIFWYFVVGLWPFLYAVVYL